MSSLCEKKSRPVAFAGTGMLEIVDPFPSQEQGTEGTKTNKYVNLGFVHDYYANCCYWAGCFSFEILTGYQLKIKKCRQWSKFAMANTLLTLAFSRGTASYWSPVTLKVWVSVLGVTVNPGNAFLKSYMMQQEMRAETYPSLPSTSLCTRGLGVETNLWLKELKLAPTFCLSDDSGSWKSLQNKETNRFRLCFKCSWGGKRG